MSSLCRILLWILCLVNGVLVVWHIASAVQLYGAGSWLWMVNAAGVLVASVGVLYGTWALWRTRKGG